MFLKQTLKLTSECFDLGKHCQSSCLSSFLATSAETSFSWVKNGHSHHAKCSPWQSAVEGGGGEREREREREREKTMVSRAVLSSKNQS